MLKMEKIFNKNYEMILIIVLNYLKECRGHKKNTIKIYIIKLYIDMEYILL